MVILATKRGKILEAEEMYFLHLVDMWSIRPSNWYSKVLFGTWKWSNVLQRRKALNPLEKKRVNCATEPDRLGFIRSTWSPDYKKCVLHAVCQVTPGNPGETKHLYPTGPSDRAHDRVRYFASCLKHMDNFVGLTPIAIPAGLGMTGPDGQALWERFKILLEQSKCEFVIYQS